MRPLWPALELVLLGYASLGAICGGDDQVTMADMSIMSIAGQCWRDAGIKARLNK